MRLPSFILIIALVLAPASPAFAGAADALSMHPPRIVAPSAVTGGTDLCFEVTCLSGLSSVLVELNDVKLPVTPGGTSGNTTKWCARVPAGTSGSTVTVTVVDSSGAVSTTTVTVS